MNPLDRVGRIVLSWIDHWYEFRSFMGGLLFSITRDRFHGAQILLQIERHGIGSLGIIILTGTFSGLALALQSYVGFKRIGAESFVGAVITTTLLRELGPVLAALMVTARSASGIAAELGTMRTSEQIDALQTLTINPYTYLVVPRIFALIISMPLLTLLSALCGILASHYLITIHFGVNSETYQFLIAQNISWLDFMGGVIKSSVFGFVIALVSTFRGFTATGGAQGVGNATKQTVVIASVAILALNYLLGLIIFEATPS
mgnify:CR=1 FL=1